MTNKNPYRKISHLEIKKTRELLKYFYEDLSASTVSRLTGINSSTVNSWYNYIREVLFFESVETDKVVRNGKIQKTGAINFLKKLVKQRKNRKGAFVSMSPFLFPQK